MLDQAKRDMQGALVANREKAVQAITQKNRLQGMMDEAVRQSAQLEKQAEAALRSGNRDLARQLLREKGLKDQTIEALKGTLAQAIETVESVKVAIKRQEEEVRRKTSEALALKAQWKQAQIQNSISKALEGLTFENEYGETSYATAKDKIRDKQAEASARQEMMAGSLQGKMMAIEDQSMDLAADAELRKLEERLGFSTTSTTNAPPVEASSDVEAELQKLEQRLGEGGSGTA